MSASSRYGRPIESTDVDDFVSKADVLISAANGQKARQAAAERAIQSSKPHRRCRHRQPYLSGHCPPPPTLQYMVLLRVLFSRPEWLFRLITACRLKTPPSPFRSRANLL